MKRIVKAGLALAGVAVASLAAIKAGAADTKPLRVVSEQSVGGFEFPESAAYDPREKVLYVSNFGGTKLNPLGKDGLGRIAKVSLGGKILDERFLPAHGEKMNSPKGIWVKGNRLWVTDIDSVWIFDLKSRKGRRLEIPGLTFANDPALLGNSLYVSDNRADRIYRIEPADFLSDKIKPEISIALAGASVYPNGLWPGKRDTLLIGGFQSPKDPRGIYSLGKHGELKELAKGVGRVDGLYQMRDGSILGTDWDSGSLFHWSEKGGMQKLASNFKGPADFTVIEGGKGPTVVVPDLPASQLRIIRLGK